MLSNKKERVFRAIKPSIKNTNNGGSTKIKENPDQLLEKQHFFKKFSLRSNAFGVLCTTESVVESLYDSECR